MKSRKLLLILLGSLTLAIGFIGIFVPLLPTTPLWMVTAWCYMRSSDRLYQAVMSNRYFGPHIRSFQVDKAISKAVKIRTLVLLWTTILVSSLLFTTLWWARVLLLLVAVGVTIHILGYKTRVDQKIDN